MKSKARFIHKSFNTCFPALLPAYFYGIPNGEMLVMYVRDKENRYLKTDLEWVLAAHLDFHFDYESGAILDFQNPKYGFEEFIEIADKLEQKVRTLKTFGSFCSHSEALQFFYSNSDRMLYSINSVESVLCNY